MSWGTYFTYEEEIIRREFGSKAEILDTIDELEEEIKDYETIFLMYAISNPKIIPDKDNEMSIPIAIKSIMEEDFQYYRQTIIELHKIRSYLEVTKLK